MGISGDTQRWLDPAILGLYCSSMVRRIRAHFDGRVIVPDEAVDLPVNQPLDLDVRQTPPAPNGLPDAGVIAERLQKLARVTGTIAGPSLPDQAFAREHLYDERV